MRQIPIHGKINPISTLLHRCALLAFLGEHEIWGHLRLEGDLRIVQHDPPPLAPARGFCPTTAAPAKFSLTGFLGAIAAKET